MLSSPMNTAVRVARHTAAVLRRPTVRSTVRSFHATGSVALYKAPLNEVNFLANDVYVARLRLYCPC